MREFIGSTVGKSIASHAQWPTLSSANGPFHEKANAALLDLLDLDARRERVLQLLGLGGVVEHQRVKVLRAADLELVLRSFFFILIAESGAKLDSKKWALHPQPKDSHFTSLRAAIARNSFRSVTCLGYSVCQKQIEKFALPPFRIHNFCSPQRCQNERTRSQNQLFKCVEFMLCALFAVSRGEMRQRGAQKKISKMPSFVCDACQETVKKPKLDVHASRCRGASFSCIDCSTSFRGTEYRNHTSCISEVGSLECKEMTERQIRPKSIRSPYTSQRP